VDWMNLKTTTIFIWKKQPGCQKGHRPIKAELVCFVTSKNLEKKYIIYA